MRIWDISPAYLNRQSLLGEHRELHGIVSILINSKKGYSKHPETLRWLEHPHALCLRHRQISCEMKLRGYNDKTPVFLVENFDKWPSTYIDLPDKQFEIIQNKYIEKEKGRIKIPENACTLWAQHKYSVMARSIKLYNHYGKICSKKLAKNEFSKLALNLTETLRIRPEPKGIRNAVYHMWSYVSKFSTIDKSKIEDLSSYELISVIQKIAFQKNIRYLKNSISLSELSVWLDDNK